MKKGILFSFLFFCKIVGHGQSFMPSYHPANYASSFKKDVTNIEILAVGAGGGGGGADGGATGTGGGSGAAVYSKINSFTGNVLTIAIGGGGGGGLTDATNTGAGAAGANGGGLGGKAGASGWSGSGGGGGGWSGVYSGATYYIVAGGGAGGGGGGEGVANERAARGGGTQTNGASGSMNGGAGGNFSGDGGGGGGGGGGFNGGNGQDPNSAANDYNSSGGGNYAHPSFTSSTIFDLGNNGVASATTAGAATTATNAAGFNYSNNMGAGGAANGGNGTNGVVIIRYPGPKTASGGVYSYVNGYSIHTFTSNGTISFVVLPVKGAMAHYMASEFASGATPTTWTDQTGNGYNATISGGVTVGTSSKNLNNNMVIKGTTASYITFPIFSNHGYPSSNFIYTNKYTLFIVTRYNNVTNMRILTDYNTNWLTSHWWGDPGVAHHNGWITAAPNSAANFAIDDWVLFTDQNSLARANGTEYTSAAPGAASGFSQLVINHPTGVWAGEKSTFEIAELIVYPRTLNSQEINFVETYLINKYGVAGYNDGLMLNLDASNKQSYDGNGTTWTDLISGNQIQWSSALAPVFKIDNGVSVFSTTPTIGTTRSIASTGYTNLREGNGAYSVMAIFKPNSVTAGKVLISMGPASSLCDGSIIHSIGIGPNGKFAGGACGALGTWNTSAGVTPTTARFWCVTTTFTGGTNGTETLYVDGVSEKTAIMTTNTPVNSINRFNIGWIRDAEPQYTLDANVAVVLYYNKALSAAEVLALYNKYKKKLNLP